MPKYFYEHMKRNTIIIAQIKICIYACLEIAEEALRVVFSLMWIPFPCHNLQFPQMVIISYFWMVIAWGKHWALGNQGFVVVTLDAKVSY